jgi:molybdenum cofactor cytidylyltransferase
VNAIAILLGAGAGARMGGSKALLVIDGAPLALLHARRMRDAGARDVVLVTRADVAPLFAENEAMRVVVTGAPDPAGSLAVGLGAVSLTGDEVLLVTPVDACPPRVTTIRALLDALGAGGASGEGRVDAATPRHAGRGGHPVAIRASALRDFAASPAPLRDRLEALGPRRVRVDVDDAAVTTDLDTPDDLLRITGAPPRFWRF